MNSPKHFDQAVFDRLMAGVRALGQEHDTNRRDIHKAHLCEAIVDLTAVGGLSEAQGQAFLLLMDTDPRVARRDDEISTAGDWP